MKIKAVEAKAATLEITERKATTGMGESRHLVHAAILGSKGEYVQGNNFLELLPRP